VARRCGRVVPHRAIPILRVIVRPRFLATFFVALPVRKQAPLTAHFTTGSRARLKVLIAHQLFGLFPEFLHVWADLLQPGALAVSRAGLTPIAIATLSFTEFVARVRQHRAGRRVWRFKLAQVHRYAAQKVACPDGLEIPGARGSTCGGPDRCADRQMTAVASEIDALLAELEEVRYLRTIPGLGWASVAGLLAHVGDIAKYRHGRQLIKLASSRSEPPALGQRRLREAVATLECQNANTISTQSPSERAQVPVRITGC